MSFVTRIKTRYMIQAEIALSLRFGSVSHVPSLRSSQRHNQDVRYRIQDASYLMVGAVREPLVSSQDTQNEKDRLLRHYASEVLRTFLRCVPRNDGSGHKTQDIRYPTQARRPAPPQKIRKMGVCREAPLLLMRLLLIIIVSSVCHYLVDSRILG